MEFFYGKPIHPDSEQEIIQQILLKYAHIPFSEELKKTIYNDLMQAKAEGIITIGFAVVVRKDKTNVHRPYIEILLETQV